MLFSEARHIVENISAPGQVLDAETLKEATTLYIENMIPFLNSAEPDQKFRLTNNIRLLNDIAFKVRGILAALSVGTIYTLPVKRDKDILITLCNLAEFAEHYSVKLSDLNLGNKQ